MDGTVHIAEYSGAVHRCMSDNRLRYRAQSLLHCFVPDPLPATAEEAADIIRWHESTRPH